MSMNVEVYYDTADGVIHAEAASCMHGPPSWQVMMVRDANDRQDSINCFLQRVSPALNLEGGIRDKRERGRGERGDERK
jgi:hypothetical protein